MKKITKPGIKKSKGNFKARKKECFFTKNKIAYIDYKNVDLLKKFIANNGKILSSRVSGTSAKYQKHLSLAIKRARIMALLSFRSK